jgi:hypothetical protein
MRNVTYQALSGVAGIAAAIAARKIVSAVWPTDADTPLNPADRRISWPEALTWGIAAAIGAGVARVVAVRGSAAAWQRVTGETPPGVKAA